MDEYIGVVRIFGGDWAPPKWMVCNGQLLPISGYRKLFDIIGTTYGGNGTTNFALPNLQSSFPVGGGRGPAPDTREMKLGEFYGEETHVLTQNELPTHNHSALASSESAGLSVATKDAVIASPGYETGSPVTFYPTSGFTNAAPNVQLHASTIGSTGGVKAHENRQPYVGMNFIICVDGITPRPGNMK